jgi:hypothetical protein
VILVTIERILTGRIHRKCLLLPCQKVIRCFDRLLQHIHREEGGGQKFKNANQVLSEQYSKKKPHRSGSFLKGCQDHHDEEKQAKTASDYFEVHQMLTKDKFKGGYFT